MTKQDAPPPLDAMPGEAPSASRLQWPVLLRLGRQYLGRHRGLTAAYLLGSLLTMSVLPVYVATSYGRLTNFFQSAPGGPGVSGEAKTGAQTGAASVSATPAPSTSDVRATYLWWVLLVLGTVAIAYGHRALAAHFASLVERDIRADTFERVLRQSPQFFHERSSDELTVVVNQLASQVQMALRQLLLDPVTEIVGLAVIGTTLYQALVHLGAERGARIYLLFGAIAAFVLISPMLIVRMGRRLQRETSDLQEQDLAVATLVGGALAAPEEVQAMQAESRFSEKYRALLAAGIRARLEQTRTIERLNALNALPGNLVLIALIGVAVLMLGSDATNPTPYTIVAVGLLTPQLMSAVQGLASFSINANLTWPAVAAVTEIAEPAPDQNDTPAETPAQTGALSIEARLVSFSYRPGAAPNVLDQTSFVIPAGSIVGLVARSGSGKTSFFRLLLRFYDPQQGEILLGGQPVQAYSRHRLRHLVGLMTQESAFFHDTVRENFRVAAPEVTDAAIQEQCVETGLWPILERVFGPRPLDAPLVAGRLSGGERKRLALTRILLRRPSVVLLDEPTVGIDPVDKLPLVDVIRRACASRTVVSVDHDLVWQTRLCDRFLVLDHGAIVQSGTASELLAQRGLFRELYDASQNEQLRPASAPAGPPVAVPAGMRKSGAPLAERA